MKPANIAVAALAGVLALAGADRVMRATASETLAAFVAAQPGLRVEAVEVSPFARAVVLRGIALQGRHRLTIGRLRLPLPHAEVGLASAAAETAAPPASPVAGTIQAEDVTVSEGAATIRIKRIDIAGTQLTDADLKALLDPKTPGALEARLRKLTAAAVVIPEIAVDDPTRGAERHALVKKVLLAGVTEGKASAFSAAEISVALTSGEDAVNGATAGVDAVGLDLVQLARVLSTRRSDAAEPIRPLLDRLAINAPKLSNVTRGVGLAAAKITATQVGARPLDQSIAAASAVAAQAGSSAASNAIALDDLTKSVALGSLDIDDATSQGKADDEETVVAAAHIGVRDLGARGIGAVDVRGFRLEGTHAKLAVGTASIGPVPVPAKVGTGGARAVARPGQVDLEQVAVDIMPRDKPVAQALRLRIEHAALAQDGGPTAIPAKGSATIDKLTFDAAPDGATRGLYDMGYRGVSFSAALTSSYDAAAQELTIHKLSLSEPAMGSAEVELRLAGVTDDLLSPNAETAQVAAIGVVAKAIDLVVVDAGLTDKALALAALRDHMGLAEERAFYTDLFANKLPVMFGGGSGVKTIGAALAKFVAAPRSLHVAIGSKDGLGVGAIGMLGDPAALFDTLDIKASAND